MRHVPDTLAFSPRLPNGITRLTFRMRFRGRLFRVTVTRHEATYELLDGEPLDFFHHGDRQTLDDKALRLKIPPIHAGPRPRQPKGREPITRRLRRATLPAQRVRARPGERPVCGEVHRAGAERRGVHGVAPYATSVLTAEVSSVIAFLASAKNMLVLGSKYSSFSRPA